MTESNPGSVEPRTLLGWTVPPHVEFKSYLLGGDDVEVLSCTHDLSATAKVTIDNPVVGDGRIGQFLRDHAHGVSVEYRPTPRQWREGDEEPPADVKELTDAKGNRMLRLERNRWRFAPFALNTKPWAAKRDYPKWNKLDEHYWMARPLTEVVPAVSSPVSGENTTTPTPSTGEDASEAQGGAEGERLPVEVQRRIDEIVVGVKAAAKVVHTLAVVVSKSGRPDMAGWLAEVAIAINAGREWPTLAPSSPLPDSETERGVWMSPDSVHLVVETDDGELDGLEHDSDAGWLSVGMYDQVPDEFIRLVPAVQS